MLAQVCLGLDFVFLGVIHRKLELILEKLSSIFEVKTNFQFFDRARLEASFENSFIFVLYLPFRIKRKQNRAEYFHFNT